VALLTVLALSSFTGVEAQAVSFIARRDFAAGTHPDSIAVGDFNGDGVADLAVANESSNSVSVLLGNGDGSFQPPRTFGAGNGPTSVAVGDFNGDGVADVAVANGGSYPYYRDGSISILLGRGDGSFTAVQTIAAGDTPASIAIADFDGNGTSDLVIVNSGYWVDDPEGGYDFVADTTSRLFLGNGDGTFGSDAVLEVGSAPAWVAVADFNEDGLPDLAVANFNSNDVSVLLGNGDGSFQAAQDFGAGNFPHSVAVGDFNGDGLQDLAVANAYSANVSVLLGNGDGSFQAARNFGAGFSPDSVVVGDFNGDGLQDLAVANAYSANVSVLLGNGDGSFQAARNFGAGSQPYSVAVGDFNGDGLPDLAVANFGSNNVSVLLGNGEGSFQGAQDFGAGSYPVSVAVGDFNGDGKPDLAVANYFSSDVSILLNNTPRRLVHQIRGLQRVSARLMKQVSSGEPAQLLIDDGHRPRPPGLRREPAPVVGPQLVLSASCAPLLRRCIARPAPSIARDALTANQQAR
jgi:predicted NUDIX family NTP pyrophosphohydrolase